MTKRDDLIERMALSLYDLLNPDQRREIRVSKADCIKLATQALAILESQYAHEIA